MDVHRQVGRLEFGQHQVGGGAAQREAAGQARVGPGEELLLLRGRDPQRGAVHEPAPVLGGDGLGAGCQPNPPAVLRLQVKAVVPDGSGGTVRVQLMLLPVQGQGAAKQQGVVLTGGLQLKFRACADLHLGVVAGAHQFDAQVLRLVEHRPEQG